MEDISNDVINKLTTQIEYYFSDKNLENDKFFNEKIREDLNVLKFSFFCFLEIFNLFSKGYVDLQFILNCNKVKSLNVTENNIVSAVKNSSEVELDSTEKKLRRKGNKPVPTLKLLNKKRKSNDKKGKEDDYEDENPDANLDP
jgi:hypothetical protein